MASFLAHNSLHSFLSSSNLKFTANLKPMKNLSIHAAISIPARDRVINFGKYKGKMLGTLPSKYLKWVSKTQIIRDFDEWGELADQVLQDPVYHDRIEWEFAERLLSGDTRAANFSSEDAVAELFELSQRFGWDFEDKFGWGKVKFHLLGTSRGGRLPRVKEKKQGEEVGELKRVEEAHDGHGKRGGGRVEQCKRGERRERLRMKRGGVSKMNEAVGILGNVRGNEEESRIGKNEVESSDRNVVVYSPFPGRESLLRKAEVFSRKNTS